MEVKTRTLQDMALIILIGGILAMPLAAEASRGHHRHGHSHYHYHDGYGHSHYHRHGKKHKYKYKRKHYYNGYNQAYYPPSRGYYNQPYYPPQPAYGYPPQRMMGISTGHGSFVIHY